MNKKILVFFALAAILILLPSMGVYAEEVSTNTLLPQVSVSFGGTNEPAEVVPALQVLFLVTIIAIAPSILLLLTGFTRIIITLHFIRAAMGTQQMPPNQVLIGVAVILTLYLMAPALTEINEQALTPFSNGEITMEQAIEVGGKPLIRFMQNQTEERDLALFANLAGEELDLTESLDAIPARILIPAFVLGELTKGFIMGFIIYLPFIVIDMVVASILMAMGMMMLPPAMISMPFKILLFILSGGWSFVINYMMLTFN